MNPLYSIFGAPGHRLTVARQVSRSSPIDNPTSGRPIQLAVANTLALALEVVGLIKVSRMTANPARVADIDRRPPVVVGGGLERGGFFDVIFLQLHIVLVGLFGLVRIRITYLSSS